MLRDLSGIGSFFGVFTLVSDGIRLVLESAVCRETWVFPIRSLWINSSPPYEMKSLHFEKCRLPSLFGSVPLSFYPSQRPTLRLTGLAAGREPLRDQNQLWDADSSDSRAESRQVGVQPVVGPFSSS